MDVTPTWLGKDAIRLSNKLVNHAMSKQTETNFLAVGVVSESVMYLFDIRDQVMNLYLSCNIYLVSPKTNNKLIGV